MRRYFLGFFLLNIINLFSQQVDSLDKPHAFERTFLMPVENVIYLDSNDTIYGLQINNCQDLEVLKFNEDKRFDSLRAISFEGDMQNCIDSICHLKELVELHVLNSKNIPSCLKLATQIQFLERNLRRRDNILDFSQFNNLIELHLYLTTRKQFFQLQFSELNKIEFCYVYLNKKIGSDGLSRLSQMSNLFDLHLRSKDIFTSLPIEFYKLEKLRSVHLTCDLREATIINDLTNLISLKNLTVNMKWCRLNKSNFQHISNLMFLKKLTIYLDINLDEKKIEQIRDSITLALPNTNVEIGLL